MSRSASLRRPRLAGGLLVHDAAVLAAANTATDDANLRRGDSVWSNEPRVRVGRGYAHVRCPRAFDYYATTAAAAFRAGDDVLRAYATAVGAGSPLQRLDSVQIDAREYASPEPLQRVPRVYSFQAMTSRSL